MGVSSFLLTFTLLSSGFLSGLARAPPGGYVTPEQIHLAYTGDQSSMYVTWSTNVYFGEGSVTFNPKDRDQNVSVVNASKTPVTHYSEDDPDLYRVTYTFRATMTGLELHTEYEYFVQNGDFSSQTFVFQTFPANEDFYPNIAVFGDMGVENHVSLDKLIQDSQTRVYDVVWHIGDIAYDMNELMGARGDMFMNLVEPIAARVPYSVIPGNHERKDNFSEYRNKFTCPPPNVFFYSYNIGPIHLVMFNTEFYIFTDLGTDQIQTQFNWLIEDLKAANEKEARARQPWIVAVGHRPMYCSNKDDYDCAPDNPVRVGYKGQFPLEDLFYQYGVDLQFYGHEHSYERLLPIYNHQWQTFPNSSLYQDPVYPVHVITGSAGNREVHSGFRVWKPEWSVFRAKDYGFTYLKVVDRLTLHLSQYSVSKAAFMDEFTLTKSQEYPSFGRN